MSEEMSPDQVRVAICARIAEGRSLRSVCTDEDMPGRRTVFDWLAKDPEFQKLYSAAMEARADVHFDEMFEIADTPLIGEEKTIKPDGTVEVRQGDMLGHRKLQVDQRKWALARMNPRKYGDRAALELSGKDGAPLVPVLNVTIGRTEPEPSS